MKTLRAPHIAVLLAGLVITPFLGGCIDREAVAATKVMAQAQGARQVAAARGKVEVEGGLLEVSTPLDGVIESVAVAEGDTVKRGQPLLQLAAASAQQDVRQAQAELGAAQARLNAQQVRIAPARALAERLQTAARAGATDLQRSDEATQARMDAEASAAVAEADVRVARERLAAASLQLARYTVRAPQDGIVLRLQAQAGARATQGGKPLFVMLPRRPLLVRAELNESFLARVRTGQRASVTSDTGNGDGTSFEGRVGRISPAYGVSRLDEDNPTRPNLRVVDCWIEFDQAPSLRVGQDVRVSFHD